MITLKQVSEQTGIPYDALRKRVNRGTLKAVKKGIQWFVSEREVKKLIKK